VADAWRRIQRFDLQGKVLGQVAAGRANDHASTSTSTLEPDVFVVTDEAVARLGDSGSPRWRWPIPTAGDDFAWGVGLDYDPISDRLAVLDLGGQRMWFLTGDGVEEGDWSFRPAAGASVPLWDLARAPSGYFVVNRSSDSIELRDASVGSVRAAWRVPGTPLRVASDRQGNAYVLNRHGWVLKQDPAGATLAAGRAGRAGDRRSRPVDLAVDDLGRVLVADMGLDRIEVYEVDPGGEPGELPTFEPTCEARGDKWADPTNLTLGETTAITLRVDGVWPGVIPRNDVVLVIDHSGSMTGQRKMEDAKDAAKGAAMVAAKDAAKDAAMGRVTAPVVDKARLAFSG
jgi:hypothetical protein